MDPRIAICLNSKDPIGAAATFELKQDVAKAMIDELAGIARKDYAADDAHLAEEYQLAAEQADAYQSTPGGTYPALQADVDAGTIDPRTANAVTTIAEAADLVIFMRATMNAALEAIRTTRLTAKAAVKTAADENAIRDVLANLSWPDPGA